MTAPNPFDVEPLHTPPPSSPPPPSPNLAFGFRVTAVLTEPGKLGSSYNLYPGTGGVSWLFQDRLHSETTVETPQGTLRLWMRAKERGNFPETIEVVASLANDLPRFPGSKLVRFDMHLETVAGVAASAIAPTPEGWHQQPTPPGVVSYIWLGGTQELSSWREKFFHAIVKAGGQAELHAEILSTLLAQQEARSFDVHKAGASQDANNRWAESLLTDPYGAITQSHSYKLAEFPNIGAAGLHEPFGHTPWGRRANLPLFALAAANLAGQRPYAIQVDQATSRNGAYCFGSGIHWSSDYGAGHVYSRDRGRWQPSLGNSGWDGPDQEHGEALIMDAAYQTGHPAHVHKALRTARTIARAIPQPPAGEPPYYFGSGFFSMRGFQRPISVAMKACYLGSKELKHYLPFFRYWFTEALSLNFQHGLPPAHLPRRPDEVVVMGGVQRWDLPILDTWQIGTKAPTFWAFCNFLRRVGQTELAHRIESHLAHWWAFLCRSMFVRADGKVAIYKQSLASNPAIGREPLVPGEDHGIIGWSARFLALPLELVAIERQILELGEATRLAGLRDRFLEQCSIAYPESSEFHTKWTWPRTAEEREDWASYSPEPLYPIETIEH